MWPHQSCRYPQCFGSPSIPAVDVVESWLALGPAQRGTEASLRFFLEEVRLTEGNSAAESGGLLFGYPGVKEQTSRFPYDPN